MLNPTDHSSSLTARLAAAILNAAQVMCGYYIYIVEFVENRELIHLFQKLFQIHLVLDWFIIILMSNTCISLCHCCESNIFYQFTSDLEFGMFNKPSHVFEDVHSVCNVRYPSLRWQRANTHKIYSSKYYCFLLILSSIFVHQKDGTKWILNDFSWKVLQLHILIKKTHLKDLLFTREMFMNSLCLTRRKYFHAIGKVVLIETCEIIFCYIFMLFNQIIKRNRPCRGQHTGQMMVFFKSISISTCCK